MDRSGRILSPTSSPEHLEVPAMDALIAAPLLLILLTILVGLSATAGVDSRDGFADDRFRQAFR